MPISFIGNTRKHNRFSPVKEVLPSPPLGTLVLDKIFTMYGDSITAGNLAGSGNSIAELLATYVTGIVANEGIGSQTSQQITARITNADPTINTPAVTRAQLNAGRVWVEQGRNNWSSQIGTTGMVDQVMSDYATAIAALTGDYAVIPPVNANIEPYGDPAWAQCISLARRLSVAYPGKVIDWRKKLMEYNNFSAADWANVLQDITPASTRMIPPENSLHPGRKGNAVIAWDIAYRYNSAMQGSDIFINPWEEFHLTSTAASTAQTNGGAVATATIFGTPDQCTLISGDRTNFTINNSGAITRSTATVLTAPYYEWQVRVVKGTKWCIGTVRVYIGASDNSSTDSVFDGLVFMVQPSGAPTSNSQKMSGFVALACAAGTDGTSMYIVGNENFGRFTIERNVNNRLRVIVKDNSAAPGVAVGVLQTLSTGVGLVTFSAGLVWYFWSMDLSPATPLKTQYINETVGGSTTQSLTSGGTAFMNTNRLVVAAQSQTNANPFKGTIRALWAATDYIDWSDPARRAEVYNSSTLAAVALPSNGAVNGIVPFLWMPGNSADRAWGYNRGTGGDFVTALLPGTQFR